MTRSEYFEKIRQYESKWGKIGESKSIMHSTETEEEENISVTEEYKRFRKKVAEGKNRERLIHSTIISPEELNARYHQELFDNGTLIHSDINKYYRKVDLGNGKWRYFYSKEEYEAYQDNKTKQGSSQDNAKGAGADYQRWLDQQKANTKNNEGDGGLGESVSNNDSSKSSSSRDVQVTPFDIEIKPNQAYENSKKGAEQAGADRAAKEKENAKNVNKVPYVEKNSTNKSEGEEMADVAKKTLKDSENAARSKKNDEGRDAAIKKGYESTAKSNKMTEINNNYDKVAAEYNDTANEVIKKYKLNDAKTQDEYNKIADNMAKDMYKAAEKAPYNKVRNADRVKLKFEEGGPTENGYKISSTVAYIPELDNKLNQLNKDYSAAVKSGNVDKASEIHDEINAVTKEYYYYCLPYMTDIMKYM